MDPRVPEHSPTPTSTGGNDWQALTRNKQAAVLLIIMSAHASTSLEMPDEEYRRKVIVLLEIHDDKGVVKGLVKGFGDRAIPWDEEAVGNALNEVDAWIAEIWKTQTFFCAGGCGRPVPGHGSYNDVSQATFRPDFENILILDKLLWPCCSGLGGECSRKVAKQIGAFRAFRRVDHQTGAVLQSCDFCQKLSKNAKADFKRCSSCKKAYYCSPECQNKDWPEHKKWCKNFAGRQERGTES